jgi:hypothetical protein
MTRLSDYIKTAKTKELIIYSKSGKPQSRMNLLTATILGVILFELTFVLAIAAIFGLLDVEIQPAANVANTSDAAN